MLLTFAAAFTLASQVLADDIIFVRPGDGKTLYCTETPPQLRDPKCISKISQICIPIYGASQCANVTMRECKDAKAGFSDCVLDAYEVYKKDFSGQAFDMSLRACKI